MLGRGTCSIALAAVLSAASPALAQTRVPEGPLSLFGGKLLSGNESAIAAGFGWPGMFFEIDFGLSDRFGLGFRADLLYGSPVGGFDVGLGFGLSVPMRVRLATMRRVDVALRLAPRFFVGELDVNRGRRSPDDEVLLGFGFEAGVLVGIRVHRQVNVIAGLTVPFLIAVDVDDSFSEVWFPVAAFGGAEYGLSNDFVLWGTIAVGPTIHGGDLGTKAEAYFWLMGGFTLRL